MKNKSGFGLIGIIIAVAIIGLLAGGGLYWREGQERKSQIQMGLEAEKKAMELRDKITQQQRQQLEAVVEKPETTQPSPIDTSTWKTYRNEKYGFEVRYPVGWEYKEGSLGPVPFGEANAVRFKEVGKKYFIESGEEYPISISVLEESKYKNSSDIAKARNRYNGSVIIIVIGGEEAAQVVDYLSTVTYVLYGGKRYILSKPNFRDDILNQQLFYIYNTMLSTFKFIPLEK